MVPVFNAGRYLNKCLCSLLNQTWNNLEIIIIDDGSTDGSGSLLDQAAILDDRIRLVHQKNAGVAVARNVGIEMATGDYLTFVDGDDFLADDYIQRVCEKALSSRADMVICGLTYVSDQNELLRIIVPEKYEKGIHEEWPMRISAVCSHFYRRSLWVESSVRFFPGERGEDIPIALYFSGMCSRIEILKYAGYYYVQHSDSAMHRFRGLRDYELPLHSLEMIIDKMQKTGLINDYLWHELFVLRIMATCMFSLAPGAEKNKKRELCNFIYRILHSWYRGYMKNPYVNNFFLTEFPFPQKAAVFLLVILTRFHLLYPFIYFI